MIDNILSKILKSKKVSKQCLTKDELLFILTHDLWNNNYSFAQNLYNICYQDNSIVCKSCNILLKFRDFRRGYGEFCSSLCSNKFNVSQIKATNFKRYGSTSWLTSNEGQTYICRHNTLKYGTATYQSSKDFKEKISRTWKQKDISDIIIQRKQLNLTKYGKEYYFETEEFKTISKETNIKKYNAANPMQNEAVQIKAAITRQNTFLNKLLTECNVCIEEDYTGCSDYRKYKWKCLSCNSLFYDDISNGTKPRCTVCYPRQGTNIEEIIINFLSKNNITYKLRDRQIIKPQEIDIYLPDFKIGIETNGLVWHTFYSGGKSRSYHLNKVNKCREQGIRLINLYEDDLQNKDKLKIIQDRLLVMLQKASNRIFSRKCIFTEISKLEAQCFCNTNHLNGYSLSSHHFGLKYNNKLVMVATFIHRKARGFIKNSNNTSGYELVRLCTLSDMIVVGGVSKIIKNSCAELKDDIFSYCDIDWGFTDAYTSAGFKYLGDTGPGFYYVLNNKRYSRFHFAKFKLKKLFTNYSEKLSERENCINNKIDTLYTTGSSKYIYYYGRR